jgi:nucleotide-binding universal stress UspA family protein
MTTLQPRHIICAVRAGAESRVTVMCAIELARETNARLTFFHTLDAEFLEYATVGPLSVVYQELIEMGKFTMLILCDRAQRRGVDKVDYVVREGNIRKQLHEFAIETQADVMVMGRPTRSPGYNVFKTGEFDDFTAKLEQDGNLKVIKVTLN